MTYYCPDCGNQLNENGQCTVCGTTTDLMGLNGSPQEESDKKKLILLIASGAILAALITFIILAATGVIDIPFLHGGEKPDTPHPWAETESSESTTIEQTTVSESTENGSAVELLNYIGKDIYKCIGLIGDMHGRGSGSAPEYSNGAVTFRGDKESKKIVYISIEKKEGYTLCGVGVNTDYFAAEKLLARSGYKSSGSVTGKKYEFTTVNDDVLTLIVSDKKIVSVSYAAAAEPETTAEETTENVPSIELLNYIGKDIYKSIGLIGDMHDRRGSTVPEFTNGAVTFRSDGTTDKIVFISIEDEGAYTLCGISVDMDYSVAEKLLTRSGFEMTYAASGKKYEFSTSDDNVLTLIIANNKIASVSYTMAEPEPPVLPEPPEPTTEPDQLPYEELPDGYDVIVNGDQIIFRLSEIPSTGYEWTYVMLGESLKPADDYVVGEPRTGTEKIYGLSCNHVLVLDAVRPGANSIFFYSTRDGEELSHSDLSFDVYVADDLSITYIRTEAAV